MDIIKEPLDVDFEVDPRPLTEAEKKAISKFIKTHKAKRLASEKRITKTKPKTPENTN